MVKSVLGVTSLLLFSYISVVLSDQISLKYREQLEKTDGFKDCAESSGSKTEDIFALPSKNTKELLCFWKCLAEKKRYLNADGTVNMDIVERDAPEKIASSIKKCLDDAKVVQCEDILPISVVLSDQIPPEIIEKLEKIDGFKDCAKSSGAKMEDLFALPPKNTQEVLCFSKCLTEKKGFLNADGTIKMDVLEKDLKEHEASEKVGSFVRKCMDGAKVIKCDDMIPIQECMFDILKQMKPTS